MIHRVRIFVLDEKEWPRCLPHGPCLHKERCLRYRAAPKQGVPAADFSNESTSVACAKQLPLPDSDAP